jgi:hypothetical protein
LFPVSHHDLVAFPVFIPLPVSFHFRCHLRFRFISGKSPVTFCFQFRSDH